MPAEHARSAPINVRGIGSEGHDPSRRASGGGGAGCLSWLALERLARTVQPVCPVAKPSGAPVEIAAVITAASVLLAAAATVATATRIR
jgi:hypothetical protein